MQTGNQNLTERCFPTLTTCNNSSINTSHYKYSIHALRESKTLSLTLHFRAHSFSLSHTHTHTHFSFLFYSSQPLGQT